MKRLIVAALDHLCPHRWPLGCHLAEWSWKLDERWGGTGHWKPVPPASGGIIDIWLTENQWIVVRDALVRRGTKEARTVSARIRKQLTTKHDHSGESA